MKRRLRGLTLQYTTYKFKSQPLNVKLIIRNEEEKEISSVESPFPGFHSTVESGANDLPRNKFSRAKKEGASGLIKIRASVPKTNRAFVTRKTSASFVETN